MNFTNRRMKIIWYMIQTGSLSDQMIYLSNIEINHYIVWLLNSNLKVNKAKYLIIPSAKVRKTNWSQLYMWMKFILARRYLKPADPIWRTHCKRDLYPEQNVLYYLLTVLVLMFNQLIQISSIRMSGYWNSFMTMLLNAVLSVNHLL